LETPLVSVIIPVYNGGKFIIETIESVLKQTIINIEVIVVNDGSKDNTPQLMTALQEKDNRIILINKLNTGVCDTRNTGIRNAAGDYIAFLDADDLWENNNLEEKVKAMQSSGSKWAHSNLYFIDEGGKMKETAWQLPAIRNFSDDIYLCDKLCICGPSSNIVVERDFMKDIFFDTTISSPADRDFCIQLARRGTPVFVNQKLWRYRVHSNSMGATNSHIADDMDLMYKKYNKQNYFNDSRIKSLALYKLYLMLCKIYIKNDKKYIKAIRSFIKYIFYRVTYFFLHLKNSNNGT
jgi:teichuronic acid biosynthesis glycosyltransferase TuaG